MDTELKSSLQENLRALVADFNRRGVLYASRMATEDIFTNGQDSGASQVYLACGRELAKILNN